MLRRNLLLLTVASALSVGIWGCGRTETPSAPAEDADQSQSAALVRERDALLARKDSFTAVSAKWALDETVKSSCKGYYEGDVLRLIEEEMTMGEFGSATSVYFYTDKGALFAYTENKESQRGARSGNAVKEKVELQLLFAPNGTLVGGERKVDGTVSELTGVEAQGATMHARELESVLQEKRSGA
jgi:hypothetical protein